MKTTVTIDPRLHDAVVLDLDGVVTDTAFIDTPDDVVPVIDSTFVLVRKLSEGVIEATAGVRRSPACALTGPPPR